MATFAIPNPFVWDKSFDVGDAHLNEQHTNLFKLIDALDKSKTAANFSALVALVGTHFHDEEKHFHGHLDAAEEKSHLETHQALVKVATSLDANNITQANVDYLKHWLVYHIKGSDMKYNKNYHPFAIPNPFVWDSSFDIGDAHLNEQHTNLFKLIDALDKEKSEANFGALVALVVKHFSDEEKHFHTIVDAAEEKEHLDTHHNLIKVAQSLDPKNITQGNVDYLKQWLVFHIKGADMKYNKKK